MKKQLLLSVLTGLLLMVSCNDSNHEQTSDIETKSHKAIEKATWLIGKWQANSEGINSMEVWKKTTDSTFSAISFSMKGKDTLFSETIHLIQIKNELLYIPNVKNQNGGKPVEFKLTHSSDTSLVFENAHHDFPQKISYTKRSGDSLLAEISGVLNGKKESQQFPMSKVR